MQQEPSADRSMRVCKKYLNAGDLCFLTFYRIQFLLSFFFSFVRPVFRFTQQKCTRLLSSHAESILIQQQQQQNEGKKSMYSLTRHVSTFQLQLHTHTRCNNIDFAQFSFHFVRHLISRSLPLPLRALPMSLT